MKRAYTVVIPAFNAEATLPDALASVHAQTEPPARIIVVDDGSTDRTAEVAAAIERVDVHRKSNGGPGSASTLGIRLVETPYLAMLDADDLWMPRKMARQLDRLEACPEVTAVFTLARLFRDRQPPDETVEPIRLWTRTTLTMRTDAARMVGDITDFPGFTGEMIDWLDRGRALGHRHEMIEDILALRRVRPGSLSDRRNDDRGKGYLQAVHNALLRRRALAAPVEARD